MKKYKNVLLDLDNTLYDTRHTEKLAIEELLSSYFPAQRIPLYFALYKAINKEKWDLLENAGIKIEELNKSRFSDFIEAAGISADAGKLSINYLDLLAKHHKYLPGAEEIYHYLTENYQVALITNGLKEAQIKRIKDSFISLQKSPLFTGEDLLIHKPDAQVVYKVQKIMNWRRKEEIILIGDSLVSDIKCAMDAGISSIWCNFTQQQKGDYLPEWTVKSLLEIKEIL